MSEIDDDGNVSSRSYGDPASHQDVVSAREPQTTMSRGLSPETCASSAPDIDPALARTIQNDIIPRLLLIHRERSAKQAATQTDPVVRDDEVAKLVALSLTEALPTLRGYIDSLRAHGLSVETVVGELLPAAARHVGWMWDTDVCTFVDVTCSLTRLQQLLRHYAPSLSLDISKAGEGRRMLLSSMPGEQHTFGLAVAEEFFRQAAWEVVPQMPTSPQRLLESVKSEWFDIVGLSASSDAALEAMPALIRKVRGASLNQSVRVIVGGPAVTRHPSIAGAAGADSIARDARDGIEKMEWMMQALRQPC